MRSTWLLLPLLTAGLTLPGCVFDDFKDIGESFQPKSPMQAATDALDPYNADLRREGVVLLSTADFGGADVYLNMYRDYVEHETDPLVRAAAITALGRHGTTEDAILIVPWISSSVTDSQNIRWVAAKALQRLHNPEVVEELIRVLVSDDDDGEVKAAVAVALGQYSEDRVFQALLLGLDDRRLSVNVDAAQSLATLTGQEWGLSRTDWQLWYDRQADKSKLFAGRQDYFYPTYQRDKLWFEHIAFWIQQSYEQPSQPAGLAPKEKHRGTWDEPTLDDT